MGNRSKTSKYLWCTLTIAVIIGCVAFLCLKITKGTKDVYSYQISKEYFPHPEKVTKEKCISVCETKECVYQSKLLFDYVNPDVNPCEDFHQFACGRHFERYDEDDRYNVADRFGNMLFTKVKHLLDAIEAKTGSASGKMKSVYDSCMAYSSNEFQGVPTVLKLLHNLGIKDWPNLAPDFRFTNHNITRVITNFLLYKEYAFVEFSTKSDYIRLEENFMFDVKANSSLNCPKSFYETQDEPTRKYLVNRILNYFKLDVKTINSIWEELESILNAVINLKQESKRKAQGNENTTTLLDCREETEHEWEGLCESMKSLIEIADATNEVNEDFATIESEEVHFMRNIFSLLSNFTDRSIANYLALNVFLNNLNDLSSYFHLSRKKEELDLTFMKPPVLKWKKCVGWITKHMTVALGHEYLKKDLTLAMIQEVQDLSNECIREASDLILQQNWLKDEYYRHSVKHRVDGIRVDFDKIFNMLLNETKVNNFYELIQYHPTEVSFLHNVFEYKKSMKIIELKGLFQTYRSDWIGSLFSVDAIGGEDLIDIYFGFLLPPVYLPGARRIMNLISLGGVILHEVGHNLEDILDPNIPFFDAEGNEYYQEKKKCLEDQYSLFRFESTGINLNGSRYIGENFADTVSIAIMDKFIENYVSSNMTNLLPSISFSLKQQLYIYSAQVWCTLSNLESDEYHRNKKIHAPDKFRLLGTMQNSKGFSEAFGCPIGSYLNPVTKCSLFD